MNTIKSLLAVLALLAFPVVAGPIFSMFGTGGIAPNHPDPDVADDGGRMVVSGTWGIAATGGGFMDGQIIFNDGFMLPQNLGDTVTFDESDITSVHFEHVVAAFGGSIIPTLGFNATGSQITSASGTISFDAGGFIITPASLTGPLSLLTSVEFDPVNLPGSFFGFSGLTMTTSTALNLVPNSQTSGEWRLTGFTQPTNIPAPATHALVVLGLLLGFRSLLRS